jgi:hypothetical protein
MDGSAPAVVNALRHALGVALREVSALPERILAAGECAPARTQSDHIVLLSSV